MTEKKVIGLTGYYCAGKNHVAQILEQRLLPVLDVDKLGYTVIETEKKRIVSRFGEDILGKDGLIDRKRLGAKVFGKSGELAALEEIIHPKVNEETLSWIKARKEKACVINAALLHRSSAFEKLDAIILVEAPFFVRLLRARKRDRLPWTALLKRFLSQGKFNSKYFKGKTDIYRVENFSCAVLRNQTPQNRLENHIGEILSLRGIT